MKRKLGSLLMLLGAVTIAGCSDTSDLQEQSLARWKAFCASQGKQFLWRDTEKERGIFLVSVKVEGRCVGPGQPGYEPPPPPDTAP